MNEEQEQHAVTAQNHDKRAEKAREDGNEQEAKHQERRAREERRLSKED